MSSPIVTSFPITTSLRTITFSPRTVPSPITALPATVAESGITGSLDSGQPVASTGVPAGVAGHKSLASITPSPSASGGGSIKAVKTCIRSLYPSDTIISF